jgi:hypothetical protein
MAQDLVTKVGAQEFPIETVSIMYYKMRNRNIITYWIYYYVIRTEKSKVNINVLLTLREQKRMYSSETKENERTKEIHI